MRRKRIWLLLRSADYRVVMWVFAKRTLLAFLVISLGSALLFLIAARLDGRPMASRLPFRYSGICALLYGGVCVLRFLVSQAEDSLPYHRSSEGKCIYCGYDLKDNLSGRCPECGKHI